MEDVIDVDSPALHAPRGIYAVFPEPELDDRVRCVPDGPVFLDLQVLESVDESALHIPGPGRPNGGVHEAFATSHRMEEVLGGVEAGLVGRLHESLRLGAQVAFLEVG